MIVRVQTQAEQDALPIELQGDPTFYSLDVRTPSAAPSFPRLSSFRCLCRARRLKYLPPVPDRLSLPALLQALRERRRLRSDPTVLKALNQWWATAVADDEHFRAKLTGEEAAGASYSSDPDLAAAAEKLGIKWVRRRRFVAFYRFHSWNRMCPSLSFAGELTLRPFHKRDNAQQCCAHLRVPRCAHVAPFLPLVLPPPPLGPGEQAGLPADARGAAVRVVRVDHRGGRRAGGGGVREQPGGRASGGDSFALAPCDASLTAPPPFLGLTRIGRTTRRGRPT